MLPKRKINKTRAGFGLLEALIASGIIIMVSTASVGLANGIIKSTATFKDRIIADNLASEAIEAAHWMRDYYINDNDTTSFWDIGYTKNDLGLLSCAVDNVLTSACDIITRTWTGKIYFNNKDASDYPITINGKNYIRRIWLVKETSVDANGNAYRIHVTVSREEDAELLSNLQTVITNWREAQ